MIAESILQRAAQIKLAIFDVDGVLTDGSVYFDDAGKTSLAFNIQDGLGLKALQSSGVEVAIITARESLAVTARMQHLGILHVYQGQRNKLIPFESLLKKLQLKPQQIAYVGDDILDLPLIQRAGLGIAVANARKEVLQQANWCTENRGGAGAAREVCELIMTAQNTWESYVNRYLDKSAQNCAIESSR